MGVPPPPRGVMDCLCWKSVAKLALCNASLCGTGGKISHMVLMPPFCSCSISGDKYMREAHCETQGMRTVFRYWADTGQLKNLWQEYSLSSVVYENITGSLLFLPISATWQFHQRNYYCFRINVDGNGSKVHAWFSKQNPLNTARKWKSGELPWGFLF